MIAADGYLLTNSHVVYGVAVLRVSFTDGSSFPGWRVGTDLATDLALIRADVGVRQTDNGKAPPYAALGDSAGVRVGQKWACRVTLR